MMNVEHLIENALIAATHGRDVIEAMNRSPNKEMLEAENMTVFQIQHITQYLLCNWIDIHDHLS